MKRNNIIDLSKGIGIFLVIFGHNHNSLTGYIYSFHMPLFFLLSGVLHSSKKNFLEFFINKFRRIMIPYFYFSGILFLFWLIIGRNIGEAVTKKTPIEHSLMGIFIGTNISNFSSIEWGVPLWFLPCIFCVTIISYYILKQTNEQIFLINLILIILNLILTKMLKQKLPWSISTALIAIPFYTFGYLLRGKIIETKVDKKSILFLLILGMISLISFHINPEVDMFSYKFNNLFIFYIGGFSGSLCLILFIKFLPENKFKWIEFLGVNSMILLACHGRALTILKFIWIVILKKSFIQGTLCTALIYTVIQILLCIPFIYIVNNYTSFLKKINIRSEK